jgi:ABC-type multidrug transport system fused ATPase/permease subunit
MFAVMFAGVQAGGNLYFLGQLSIARIGACVYEEYIIKGKDVDQILIIDDASNGNMGGDGGTVKISNVWFEYENRNTPVLDNFSLEVNKNEKVALVGESGSGKSTVTSLLFKLY